MQAETTLSPDQQELDRQLRRVWGHPKGLLGWFSNVHHTAIGLRFMVTSFIFFLLGGVLAAIMRTQLATVLLADKSIKDVNYTTDVVHGVVYLMGIAQNREEMDRVVAHAQKVNGVKRVENYVVLKDDPVRNGFPEPPPQ